MRLRASLSVKIQGAGEPSAAEVREFVSLVATAGAVADGLLSFVCANAIPVPSSPTNVAVARMRTMGSSS